MDHNKSDSTNNFEESNTLPQLGFPMFLFTLTSRSTIKVKCPFSDLLEMKELVRVVFEMTGFVRDKD